MNIDTQLMLTIGFIGGGNMARAMIGGLISQGQPTSALLVVDPWEAQRSSLAREYPGLIILATAEERLATCDLVIWAVKPQAFKEAALDTQAFVGNALHLSVAAGITSDSIAAWLHTERIVRAMPNTPSLVGLGMTGLFARPAASRHDCALVEHVMKNTGELVWVETEIQLDAVTALSGSGPAYVFYFLEAMRNAGVQMGLAPELAQRLAMGTFTGATGLAQHAAEPLEVLRERVTSKGGTTHAAISLMEAEGVGDLFQQAMLAAHRRATELGATFGN